MKLTVTAGQKWETYVLNAPKKPKVTITFGGQKPPKK